MLRLEYGTVFTKFRGDPIATEAVRNLLTAEVKSHSGGRREQATVITDEDCFPSGLYNTVKYRMLNQGFEVQEHPVITLPEDAPEVSPGIIDGITLYPYQLVSVQEQVRRKRGNVEIGTGGGKSIIHGAFLKHVNESSATVVYRKRHARQLYDVLKNKCGLDVELLDNPNNFTGEHQHVVGHADAFHGGAYDYGSPIGHFLTKVGIVSWDEAHHMRKMYQSVARATEQAEYRIGYSATPYNSSKVLDDIRDLEVLGYTGDTIIQVPAHYLIQHGYLDPATILMVTCVSPEISDRVDSYNKVYDLAYVENYHLHTLVMQVVQVIRGNVANPKILIIVDRINHGHKLLFGLHNYGFRAKFSSGQDKVWYVDGQNIKDYDDPDDEIADEFVAGEMDVLIGSVIFEEAVDLPEVTDVIIACGGRKRRRTKQRVGRAVRLTPQGCEFCGIIGVRVWDFFLTAHRYPRNQARVRLEDYTDEGHSVYRGYLEDILQRIGVGH